MSKNKTLKKAHNLEIPIIIADKPIDVSKIKNNYAYIIAKDGIMLLRRTDNFENLSVVEGISHLEEIESFVKIKNFIKIPYSVIYQAIDFFDQVYKKYKTEALLIIHKNNMTNEHGLTCPKQTVSASDLKWESKITFPENCSQAGTIHSHADFSAFFSGTDNGDDKGSDGVHIVIGKLDEKNPEIVCSYVAGGVRQKLELKDTAIEDKAELWANPEWINLVTKEKSYWEKENEKTVSRTRYWDFTQNKWIWVKDEEKPIQKVKYEDYYRESGVQHQYGPQEIDIYEEEFYNRYGGGLCG